MTFAVTFATLATGLSVRLIPSHGKLPNTLTLGLVLDRCYIGERLAKPDRRRGALTASLALPGHRVAETLDLLDVATGQSLLPAPYPLDAFYDLRPGAIAAADGWLQGGFSVRGLDERVLIDFMAGGRLVATGLATRHPAHGSTDYQFRVPLLSTVTPQTPIEATAHVAGKRLASCVQIAAPPPFRGFFDRLHGLSAHGWAIDDRNPQTPVTVEAVCDGHVLAAAEANLFRADLVEAGLNHGLCAFKIDIGRPLLDHLGRDVFVRIAGQDNVLQGSPRTATPNPNLLRHLAVNREIAPATLERLKRTLNHRVGGRLLSIVMPVCNPPKDWLIEALTSVLAQWCGHWELICIDDGSTAPHVADILRAFSGRDRRVRVLRSAGRMGAAAATNIGLRAASAAYVTFMADHDTLEPDAVYHLLQTAAQTTAGLIYSDAAATGKNINSIAEVNARPAFSYDFYLSHPYFGPMICVRRDLAYQVGGCNAAMPLAFAVDFVLRLLETDPVVAHVARVLYRCRAPGSNASPANTDAVMVATRQCIQQHLDRRATGAVAEAGAAFNHFRIHWPAADGRILIVIPTKNRADLLRVAIHSIERTAGDAAYRIVVVDHQSDEPASQRYLRALARRHTVMRYAGAFNYAQMNNRAVKQHAGDCKFVLFLNNDVEAVADGWLDRMRRLANRPEVGAVGALLLYPDKRIQHAGVIVGFNGSAEATFKFEHAYLDERGQRNPGYGGSITAVRDYSAVTAACLMMRTQVFLSLGGFDEALKVAFNDVDLCLRVRRAGLKVLYDGNTVLFHYESATRRRTPEVQHPEDTARLLTKHREIFAHGDPFYNPNLSDQTQDHLLREDAGCKPLRVRITTPTPPPRRLVYEKRKAALVKSKT